MFRYLGLASEYPFLNFFGEILYYSLAFIAVAIVMAAIYKRLVYTGHDKKKVALFILVYLVMGFPSAFLGSHAAGMFYEPMNKWSFDLLWHKILSGGSHTFHASIILPLILLSIFTLIKKYRYFEVMDTAFLYIPIGHAVGRVGCIIIGCCWGRSCTLDFMGFHTRFINPVPLYSILMNIFIFYFLKRLYTKIYMNSEMQKKYEGAVMASYLMLYGFGRIILEMFRRETKIVFALTQAQIIMILFILISLILWWVIRYRRRQTVAVGNINPVDRFEINKLFYLLGIIVSSLAVISVYHHLTYRVHILPWLFREATSLTDAYSRIFGYVPMMILPILAIYWLQKINFPILQKFKWNRFSKVFYLGLAVSIYYSIDLLILREPQLRGLAFWSPVIILSLMNAISEETLYRLGIFSLFRNAGYSKLVSITIQSLLYSLVHFMISPTFGVLSFIYGFLLGVIMDRSDSVTPCIICHFVIDIGCIGLPLLAY